MLYEVGVNGSNDHNADWNCYFEYDCCAHPNFVVKFVEKVIIMQIVFTKWCGFLKFCENLQELIHVSWSFSYEDVILGGVGLMFSYHWYKVNFVNRCIVILYAGYLLLTNLCGVLGSGRVAINGDLFNLLYKSKRYMVDSLNGSWGLQQANKTWWYK